MLVVCEVVVKESDANMKPVSYYLMEGRRDSMNHTSASIKKPMHDSSKSWVYSLVFCYFY